jgi:5'-nucleotidase
LKKFLDFLKSTSACHTEVLAANVKPQIGTPLAANSATDYMKPYMVKTYNNESVGIIGITIRGKTLNSSRPDVTTQFADEAESAQQVINELHRKGINKIIVMSHYGYDNDLLLAKKLSGVDVIIGGDSHTLLGNRLKDVGLNPSGDYPTQTTDKDGNLVCVAQAWQYALAVGELNVRFDAAGKVSTCSGTSYILLGDSFKRNNTLLTGADREAVLHVINTIPELAIVSPNASAAALLTSYSSQIEQMKKTVIGTATDNLCLVRIPGESRSKICDASVTRAHGSDISNLVALAFKQQSLRADMAIQNAGSVRSDIAAGSITIGDAYLLLPFANTLTNLSLTGKQIVDVLEEALAFALDPNGSTGAYPYAFGLRWDVDLSKPQGQRFFNVQVKPKNDDTWSPIDLNRTYVIVTNNFTASGKDGYNTFGEIYKDPTKVEETYLDYAQSFVDYVKKVGALSKLPVSEYSTQNFYDKEGKLQ